MLQLQEVDKERRSLTNTSADSFTVPLLVITMTMSSTLLFKFNGFDNLSDEDIFPDEIRDAGMSPVEWRETSSPTDGSDKPLPEANDGWGGVWGVCIFAAYFRRDVPSPPAHHYEIRVTKQEANNSIVSRSLGYQVTSRARIIVRDANGEICMEKEIISTDGSFYCDANHRSDNCRNILLMMGGAVMEALEENAFIVELQIDHDFIEREMFHLPPSPMVKNLLKMLASGEDADISFLVGDTEILAHKLILKLNAGQLYQFVDRADVNFPVKVEGTTPEVFKLCLEYIYGDDRPDLDFLLEHYEDVIDVSNKYGVIGLKLQAEVAKIASLTIDASNVIEHLRFADSKNCTLLKEYATSVYISNFDMLVRSSSFEELAKSPDVLRDLVIAISNDQTRSDATVNDLIGELIDLDLDVDGTKETLIARLDKYHEEHPDSSEESDSDEEMVELRLLRV